MLKKLLSKKELMPFFIFLVVAEISVFIIIYCKFFNDIGLLAKARLLENPISFVILTPICFWISAYLCRKFAFYAAGNSTERIKESLEILEKEPENYKKISHFFSFKLIIIKVISSLLCCFGGGSLGSEGPSVHMASGIFASTANKFKNYLPKISYQTCVFAGGAVGIAIAFNAPVAGFVFAAEKMLRSHNKNFRTNIIWVLITILIVTVTLYQADKIFISSQTKFDAGSHLFLFALTSIFCGILAFLFKKTNSYFFNKISSIKSNWWHLFPIIGGLLVGFISLYSGIYSFGSGVQTVNYALANQGELLSYKEVLGRILNTIISFVSGCAGGLIAPSIAIGAGIGSILGATTSGIDVNLFIIVGMVAFLSAILGEPITAAIVIFEATYQPIDSIPFLIVGALVSFITLKGLDMLKTCQK